MKVFIEGNNTLIKNMFHLNGWDSVSNLEEADLVCFGGGTDVSPELYGELNTHSICSAAADWRSLVLYNNAKRLGLAMVGICRGGQFLNVMAGGKMIQHYDGHGIRGTHEIIYFDHLEIKQVCQVTSTHHQVMKPNLDKQNLIGWAGGDWQGDVPVEAEIVWNWYDNSLSFQPHPEYVTQDHECQKLFFTLLSDYFGL